MKRINTAPVSGMQELTPRRQKHFDEIKEKICEVYRRHGFLRIETPTIERTEVLLAKAGGETEKQIYKVVKTAQTEDEADQALRFDHTVPLARYVVQHQNTLVFPFRVTQVGRNFRGERTQKGRAREFYQLDADIIGHEKLALAYDAEIIFTAMNALATTIHGDFTVKISNRKLLTGLIKEFGLEEKSAEIFLIIDRAEKVPPQTTLRELTELQVGSLAESALKKLVMINGGFSEVSEKLEALEISHEIFKLGLKELKELDELLARRTGRGKIIYDLRIVRGLDYYTGTIFETTIDDYPEAGSICSGGRYEQLAENFTNQSFPGVGMSIGLTRLFMVLGEERLIITDEEKPVEIMLLPLSAEQYPAAMELADKLRRQGRVVDLDFTEKKLGARIGRADKLAKFAVVIGEDEVRLQSFKQKDLASGETTELVVDV